VPRPPQLASPPAPRSARGRPRRFRRRCARLAQQRRSCAAKQPRGGGRRPDHPGPGGGVSPLQQPPCARPHKQRRGPTSSGGHFSPLQLGAAVLGDAARVADNALSDSRLYAARLEAQAAASGSLARLATALAYDPVNCAREAAEQLKWCAKQAPAAARALRKRVGNRGARSVVRSWCTGAGGGIPETRHTQGVCAPRPSPLAARVRSQSPRAGRNSRSQSPLVGASELGCDPPSKSESSGAGVNYISFVRFLCLFSLQLHILPI
jgi:hypothetical protein